MAADRFVASLADRYDAVLGPALFEPYAVAMADEVARGQPRSVLETACGTGILTARLRAALPDCRLVATDLSPGMLARSCERVGEPASWTRRVADFAALPFAGGEFDAVACQFGLMFAADLDAAVGEARRVLGAGGRLVVAVWAPEADNPHALAIRSAIAAVLGARALPPFVAVPSRLGDGVRLHDALRRHGLAVERDTVEVRRLRCADARDLAEGFLLGTPLGDALADAGEDPHRAVGPLERALATAGGRRPYRAPMAARIVAARRDDRAVRP